MKIFVGDGFYLIHLAVDKLEKTMKFYCLIVKFHLNSVSPTNIICEDRSIFYVHLLTWKH